MLLKKQRNRDVKIKQQKPKGKKEKQVRRKIFYAVPTFFMHLTPATVTACDTDTCTLQMTEDVARTARLRREGSVVVNTNTKSQVLTSDTTTTTNSFHKGVYIPHHLMSPTQKKKFKTDMETAKSQVTLEGQILKNVPKSVLFKGVSMIGTRSPQDRQNTPSKITTNWEALGGDKGEFQKMLGLDAGDDSYVTGVIGDGPYHLMKVLARTDDQPKTQFLPYGSKQRYGRLLAYAEN